MKGIKGWQWHSLLKKPLFRILGALRLFNSGLDMLQNWAAPLISLFTWGNGNN